MDRTYEHAYCSFHESCVSLALNIRVTRSTDRPWNALTTLFVWSLSLLPLPLPDWLRVDFRLYRDERTSLRKFPTITISDVHMSLSLRYGPSKKRAINWPTVWDRDLAAVHHHHITIHCPAGVCFVTVAYLIGYAILKCYKNHSNNNSTKLCLL